MKKLILTLTLFTTPLISLASSLEKGHCKAKPESKRYLSNPFSDPYPREVKFTCIYKCQSSYSSSPEKIKGTSVIISRNQNDDALKTVCQGVRVRQTNWGHDFDRVDSFYAYTSKIDEVREWAQEKVSRDNPTEIKLVKNLIEVLKQTQHGYQMAGQSAAPTASSFELASDFLKDLISALENQKLSYFDHLLLKVVNDEKLVSDETANQLIKNILKTQARWRLP